MTRALDLRVVPRAACSYCTTPPAHAVYEIAPSDGTREPVRLCNVCVEALATAVVAAGEACARACDDVAREAPTLREETGARACADRIRAGGGR